MITPKISIVEIEILQKLPKEIIAETGFDVLCHALEVYTRNDCTEEAKVFCVKAMELIKENLIDSHNNKSIDNKIGMAFADIYAGIALALIGTHLPHAIAHPISARLKLSHGRALASIIPETIKSQVNKTNQIDRRFKEVSKILSGQENIIRCLDFYIKGLNLNHKNTSKGGLLKKIYEDTLGYRKSSVEKCPVKISKEEIKKILKNSFALEKSTS